MSHRTRQGCGNRVMVMLVRMLVRVSMAVGVLSLMMKWVRVMLARSFGVAIHDDINFGRADAAAIHTRDFERRADVQGFNGSPEKLDRNSCIDQSAEKHVTADSGEAVEVGNPVVGRRSPVVGRTMVVRCWSFVVRQIRTLRLL